MRRDLVVIIILVILITTLFFWVNNQNKSDKKDGVAKNIPISTSSEVHFTATFEIYTRGTKRIFSESKYHNLSPDVYISPSETNVVHVWKKGITWRDFFSTLPMEVTKECLTTGTGQKFCTNEKERLKFFINKIEFPEALTTEIRNSDKLQVIYE